VQQGCLFLIIGFMLLSSDVAAQQDGRRTSTGTRPPGLKSELILHPDFVPEDLESLVNYSPLIVRGVVGLQLPSRCAVPNCSILYTDFEFAVTRLLKSDGTERKFDKVIVSQDGGKLGDAETSVVGDTLMRVGEEYVLCLAYDSREDRLKYDGARWAVRGIWHGKFKVKDGKIAVEENSVFKKTVNGSFNPKSVEDIAATDLESQIGRALAK
jgi:hypothetical protein